jgi:hypothetical protein
VLAEQLQNHPIYDRSDGLDQIVHERAAVALVGMEDPETRVEAVRMKRDHRLGFHDRVRIINERVEGCGRLS